MFETKTQKLAEILSEVLLLTTSALIQQLMLAVGETEKQNEIEQAVFVALGILVAINVAFLIKQIFTNCKEKRRQKLLEQKRNEW